MTRPATAWWKPQVIASSPSASARVRNTAAPLAGNDQRRRLSVRSACACGCDTGLFAGTRRDAGAGDPWRAARDSGGRLLHRYWRSCRPGTRANRIAGPPAEKRRAGAAGPGDRFRAVGRRDAATGASRSAMSALRAIADAGLPCVHGDRTRPVTPRTSSSPCGTPLRRCARKAALLTIVWCPPTVAQARRGEDAPCVPEYDRILGSTSCSAGAWRRPDAECSPP